MSHSAREAVLAATVLPPLLGTSKNLSITESEYNDCFDDPDHARCPHTIVQWRLRRLLQAKMLRIEPTSIEIETSADPASSETFSVEVSADYRPVFGFLGVLQGSNMTVRESAYRLSE